MCKIFFLNEYYTPAVAENPPTIVWTIWSNFSTTDFSLLSVYFAGTVLLLLHWQLNAIIVKV